MLVYKAVQVIAIVKNEPKPWEMGGRSGVTHSAKMAVIGENADVASITLKSKSAEDLTAKIGRFHVGKPTEVRITDIVPVFKQGDRKAASYEFTA